MDKFEKMSIAAQLELSAQYVERLAKDARETADSLDQIAAAIRAQIERLTATS